jgi:hypothetical protein
MPAAKAILKKGMKSASGSHARKPRAEGSARCGRKEWTMKHIVGKVFGTVGCLGVIGACAALIAGKDDIRKFHRMLSM